MSDLDDEILTAVGRYSDGVSSNTNVIAEIKQAFIDAGYTQKDWRSSGTINGERWYDRFHEELLGMFGKGLEVEDREYHSIDSVLSAAKKAAGL